VQTVLEEFCFSLFWVLSPLFFFIFSGGGREEGKDTPFRYLFRSVFALKTEREIEERLFSSGRKSGFWRRRIKLL